MTASTTESAFQNDILREMEEGGWVRGSADRYDRACYPEGGFGGQEEERSGSGAELYGSV